MTTDSILSASGPRRQALADVPQVRACLKCRTPFQSDGFGERICRACKGTDAWRTAVPVRRGRPRGRIGPGSD
jgi:hypothetical protein